MFLTMNAAREALAAVPGGDDADLGEALAGFARGALLGARGNSGVILSQMLGAVGARLAKVRLDDRHAEQFARALHEASDASYAAVGPPREAIGRASWREKGGQ